jgi:hypothetical protein
MTILEAAITITKGFIAQEWRKSVVQICGRDICKYRNSNGDKCAAGHLLPDSEYTPSVEGQCAPLVPYFQSLPSDLMCFIYEAQLCHDSSYHNHLKPKWIKFLKREEIFDEVCLACPELES